MKYSEKMNRFLYEQKTMFTTAAESRLLKFLSVIVVLAGIFYAFFPDHPVLTTIIAVLLFLSPSSWD